MIEYDVLDKKTEKEKTIKVDISFCTLVFVFGKFNFSNHVSSRSFTSCRGLLTFQPLNSLSSHTGKHIFNDTGLYNSTDRRVYNINDRTNLQGLEFQRQKVIGIDF